MKPAKIAVVTLFLLMAIGGISGVMLARLFPLLCVAGVG
ncbi:membrane protein [Klebsiella pneumoniae]|uniref:Membrane protein n=1 Tax=Klebsiella pneumoniae TaxID=573 RepID=A0A377XPV6_KLEPN|nr:membrane protein [Klebsiella pneumoniae]